jgi:hypothetical protein
MSPKPEREPARMPKKTSSLGGKSGELSSAELQRVSGGTDATPNTEVVLKKLPGKRKPPTVTL